MIASLKREGPRFAAALAAAFTVLVAANGRANRETLILALAGAGLAWINWKPHRDSTDPNPNETP